MSHMKLNKAKCKVLHLGWGIPKHGHRLGDEQIERCPGTWGAKGSTSHQCALIAHEASHILDCTDISVVIRLGR